jgi:hypothetical protein
MAVSIQNLVKCEVRAVIRFLHAKGETAAILFLFAANTLRTGKMWQNGAMNLKREEVMFMME